jgi:hypothetical protein
MADDETDAEKQVRLHYEKECRRIAELVKAELPEDRGFILITTQRGEEAGASFASCDYVSTVDPRDALRLLHEFVGRLTRRTRVVGEPTVDTATVMREHVYSLMEGLDGKPPPSPSKIWQRFCRARAGGSVSERVGAFISLGVVAMLELEHLQRQQLKGSRPAPRERSAPPPPVYEAPTALAAEEIVRHVIMPRDAPAGDTKTTLVADLREKPPSEAREHLIALALAGRFHDYESESATPKVDLHDALAAVGYADLALKVRAGAYDHEPPTFEQEEDLRQEVGAEFFDKIMGQKPRGSS